MEMVSSKGVNFPLNFPSWPGDCRKSRVKMKQGLNLNTEDVKNVFPALQTNIVKCPKLEHTIDFNAFLTSVSVNLTYPPTSSTSFKLCCFVQFLSLRRKFTVRSFVTMATP